MALNYQYPGTFLKLVWGGPLYAAEQWSCSLNMVPNSGEPSPAWNVDQVPAAVRTAIETFHTTPSLICAAAKLSFIKANVIGADGRYVNQTDSNTYEYATPLAGGATGATPPQIALAVSIVTAAQRGLASKGRFYLPVPSLAMDTVSGRLSESNALTAANAAATLANALNQWAVSAGHGIRVGVASGGPVRNGIVTGPGAFRVATGFRVGTVLDTQRRRRADIPEVYKVNSTAVTP